MTEPDALRPRTSRRLVLTVGVLCLLAGGCVLWLDGSAAARLNLSRTNGRYVLKFLSNVGEREALLVIFLGALVIWNEVELALGALIAAGSGSLVASLLKSLIGRPRPDGGDGSLPSGHATAAFAVAFVVARRFPRFRILAYFGALVISATRVLLHKHYLSDIMAGAALGLAIGAASVWLWPALRRLGERSWLRAAAFGLLVFVVIHTAATSRGMQRYVLCSLLVVGCALVLGRMARRRTSEGVEVDGPD